MLFRKSWYSGHAISPQLFVCGASLLRIVVRMERLELSWVPPPPPQDGVSASSTISAMRKLSWRHNLGWIGGFEPPTLMVMSSIDQGETNKGETRLAGFPSFEITVSPGFESLASLVFRGQGDVPCRGILGFADLLPGLGEFPSRASSFGPDLG
jgi:hypothetical protein